VFGTRSVADRELKRGAVLILSYGTGRHESKNRERKS
jgi:hypothetical protein